MRRRSLLTLLPVTRGAGLQPVAPRAKPPAPRSVALDTDGMLSIGGRREFILGLYTLPRVPDPWRQVQEAGFNLVRLRPNPEDFSSAQAHQLYGWVALGSVSPATVPNASFPEEVILTAGATPGQAVVTVEITYCPPRGVMVYGMCSDPGPVEQRCVIQFTVDIN